MTQAQALNAIEQGHRMLKMISESERKRQGQFTQGVSLNATKNFLEWKLKRNEQNTTAF